MFIAQLFIKQTLQTMYISINGRLDKYILIHLYNGILYTNKKNRVVS